MLSLSLNHLLEVFENHLALSGPKAGDTMLFFSDSRFFIGNQPTGSSFRNLALPARFNQPLSELEERRLRALDRKAKGGLLTEQEDIEFEGLLEIKRYYSMKQVNPSLTHHELLSQLRA